MTDYSRFQCFQLKITIKSYLIIGSTALLNGGTGKSEVKSSNNMPDDSLFQCYLLKITIKSYCFIGSTAVLNGGKSEVK